MCPRGTVFTRQEAWSHALRPRRLFILWLYCLLVRMRLLAPCHYWRRLALTTAHALQALGPQFPLHF